MLHNAFMLLFKDGLECANDFILHDGSCYYYSGQDANKAFHQAEKACRRRNSTLVSIRSSSEHDFVARLVHNGSFWIGLNDADGPSQHHKEGVFKWTDGGSFVEVHSYSRWKEGEPQNHRHLDCIRSDADGWSIAQGGCATTKLPYVCEMNGTHINIYACATIFLLLIRHNFLQHVCNGTRTSVQAANTDIYHLHCCCMSPSQLLAWAALHCLLP